MKYIKLTKRGDISVLISILITSILLILLMALAQKSFIDTRISRENLMSQQAIQAAKTAVEAWEYQLTQSKVSNTNDSLYAWPNPNSIGVENLSNDNQWVIMSTANGATIQYRAEYRPGITAYIVGRGRVILSNGVTVERTFENKF